MEVQDRGIRSVKSACVEAQIERNNNKAANGCLVVLVSSDVEDNPQFYWGQ